MQKFLIRGLFQKSYSMHAYKGKTLWKTTGDQKSASDLKMLSKNSLINLLLRLDSSRRRSFLQKKRKIEKGPEKSAYYDKLV